MKCCEFNDFLVDYEDGMLPAEVLAVFEEHMRRCPPCLSYLKTYRLTIHIGRHACRCGDANSEADVPEPLVQAILAACRRAT